MRYHRSLYCSLFPFSKGIEKMRVLHSVLLAFLVHLLWLTPVLAQFDSDEHRKNFARILIFFDELVVCARSELCDSEVLINYFGSYGTDFFLRHAPIICDLRRRWRRPLPFSLAPPELPHPPPQRHLQSEREVTALGPSLAGDHPSTRLPRKLATWFDRQGYVASAGTHHRVPKPKLWT